MSSHPPQTLLADVEPTAEQIDRARRIARATGRTTDQVLSEALGRGASSLYAAALARPTPDAGPRH